MNLKNIILSELVKSYDYVEGKVLYGHFKCLRQNRLKDIEKIQKMVLELEFKEINSTEVPTGIKYVLNNFSQFFDGYTFYYDSTRLKKFDDNLITKLFIQEFSNFYHGYYGFSTEKQLNFIYGSSLILISHLGLITNDLHYSSADGQRDAIYERFGWKNIKVVPNEGAWEYLINKMIFDDPNYTIGCNYEKDKNKESANVIQMTFKIQSAQVLSSGFHIMDLRNKWISNIINIYINRDGIRLNSRVKEVRDHNNALKLMEELAF